MEDNIVLEIRRGESSYEWYYSSTESLYTLLGLLDSIKYRLLRDVDGQLNDETNLQIPEVPE